MATTTRRRSFASPASPSSLSTLPFLVHDVGAGEDGETQFCFAGESILTSTIDLLHHHRCFETPQGWILALDPVSLRTFLWRTEDDKRIDLPAMEEDFPSICKCLLSGKATAANSVVVVLSLVDNDYWFCRIKGGTRWQRYGYIVTVHGAKRHMALFHGVAALGGKLYYELSGYGLGVVDFDHPDADGAPHLTSIEVDTVDTCHGPDTATVTRSSSYLVESRGELFLAVVFLDFRDAYKFAGVAVYRMDFAAAPAAWRRVDGIGDDRVLLLGGDVVGTSNFGASCSAVQHGLRGNRIYFLNHIAFKENFLHVIDLADGSEVVQRPFQGFPAPLRPPFWMMLADS